MFLHDFKVNFESQYSSVKPRNIEFLDDASCGSLVVAFSVMGRLVTGSVGASSNGGAANHSNGGAAYHSNGGAANRPRTLEMLLLETA